MIPQTFIFIGKSGSGKGTQIDLLKKYISDLDPSIDTHSFVMGDVFRTFMRGEGYAQETIKKIASEGRLVPDLIANSMFVSNLLNNLKSNDHLYIDGIPRSPLQAEAIIEIIKFYNRSNPIIINIEVSDEEVKRRMILRARADDTQEAISERLKYYNENVTPALLVLKEKSDFIYLEINGERTIEEIHTDIVEQLKNILKI